MLVRRDKPDGNSWQWPSYQKVFEGVEGFVSGDFSGKVIVNVIAGRATDFVTKKESEYPSK
jgi:hypothetical protein